MLNKEWRGERHRRPEIAAKKMAAGAWQEKYIGRSVSAAGGKLALARCGERRIDAYDLSGNVARKLACGRGESGGCRICCG
jgi:hypothetical protein